MLRDHGDHIRSVMMERVSKHINQKADPIKTNLNKVDSVLRVYGTEKTKKQCEIYFWLVLCTFK